MAVVGREGRSVEGLEDHVEDEHSHQDVEQGAVLALQLADGLLVLQDH